MPGLTIGLEHGQETIQTFIPHRDEVAHQKDERPPSGRRQSGDGVADALDEHPIENSDQTNGNRRLASARSNRNNGGKDHPSLLKGLRSNFCPPSVTAKSYADMTTGLETDENPPPAFVFRQATQAPSANSGARISSTRAGPCQGRALLTSPSITSVRAEIKAEI